MKKITLIIALIIGCTLIVGCKSQLSPVEGVLFERAVKAGTYKFIVNNPNRVSEIISITESIADAVEDQDVDLVELREIVESSVEIDDLNATESILLNQLLALIGVRINAEALDENKIVRITQVLEWINEVAVSFRDGAPLELCHKT